MKSYKKNTLIAFMILMSSTSFAQRKINYGVGIEMFQTKLNNVDRENFNGYGHSYPGFEQNNRLGFGATFLASKPIYKNLSFETGLGLTNFSTQFHFDYLHRLLNEQRSATLNISLYYLKIPLFITYHIPTSKKSTFNISAGADFRTLLLGDDNFQEIIYEHVYLGNSSSRYRNFIFSSKLP